MWTDRHVKECSGKKSEKSNSSVHNPFGLPIGEAISTSLVMTGCPLSGRGQGRASNFFLFDLENFATTAIRRCIDRCDQQTRRRWACGVAVPSPAELTECALSGGPSGRP